MVTREEYEKMHQLHKELWLWCAEQCESDDLRYMIAYIKVSWPKWEEYPMYEFCFPCKLGYCSTTCPSLAPFPGSSMCKEPYSEHMTREEMTAVANWPWIPYDEWKKRKEEEARVK